VSPIPFESNSDIGEAISSVILRENLKISSFVFDGSSQTRDVYAFSTLQSALQPMAFASLIDPIAQAWLELSGSLDGIHSFWDGRRARPLLDAIPASPNIVKSYIAGWFIADAFGWIQKSPSPNPQLGEKVSLWHPDQGPLSFPWPLLPASPQDSKLLPQVLVSLSLAIIDAGKQSTRAPLFTYEYLRDIGREVTYPDPDRIGALSNPNLDIALSRQCHLLADWVQTGQSAPTAPRAQFLSAEVVTQNDLDSPTQRRDFLMRFFAAQQVEYRNYWTDLAARPWTQIPHIYELRDTIDEALAVIVEALSAVTLASAPSHVPTGS
jgi:hypothetical protein